MKPTTEDYTDPGERTVASPLEFLEAPCIKLLRHFAVLRAKWATCDVGYLRCGTGTRIRSRAATTSSKFARASSSSKDSSG